ncbi:MAG: endonuclease/exonuclease/phosphatase family protein [Pyrinomonadaceae bacterium]
MSDFALLACQALFACVLLLAAAGRLGRAGKYFELASHFRVQYLVASSAGLLVFIVTRQWTWAAAALLYAALETASVLPYYLSPQRRVAVAATPRRKLRVLLANVNYHNPDLSPLIELAHSARPDILIVQEATDEWCAGLKVLRATFPHEVLVPRPRGAGIALFSRLPLANPKIIFDGENQRPGIVTRLDLGGGHTLTLLTMHTHAPIRRRHFGYRNALLSEAASLVPKLPRPLVVVGDLNTTPWSPHFSLLLRAGNLREARLGFGLLPTWPVWLRFALLMIPIDHCLLSPEVETLAIKAGPDIGSDHLPVLFELSCAVS